MVDFHTHILPGMDDGASDVQMSLAMLRESRRQGVDYLFATSHFYADEEDPDHYLRRRNAAYVRLMDAMGSERTAYPRIALGAEVLYFPGISQADEIGSLIMGNTSCLLIEPPMLPWSDFMLDELEQLGSNMHCIPVIAHLDRYIRILKDKTLFERVAGRRILIQVNGNMFIHRDSRKLGLHQLAAGNIHFLGSDCHNTDDRAQNLGKAREIIVRAGEKEALERFEQRIHLFFEDIL